MERVYAVAAGVDLGQSFSPAKSFSSWGQLVSVIVKNAFVVAGVIALFLLIFGGFSIIVAAGDTKKLDTGKKAITGAVIGLLVVVGSIWIVQLLGIITGLPLPIPK